MSRSAFRDARATRTQVESKDPEICAECELPIRPVDRVYRTLRGMVMHYDCKFGTDGP